MSIEVNKLSKTYRIPVKKTGLIASIKSIFSREWKYVTAVDNVGFSIQQGEKVGFLGPNGAGKTTTLKMLTGLLHPTTGEASVLGHTPQSRARPFLKSITLVMGQKQQLVWDIPPQDTFDLNRALFDIPHKEYQKTKNELLHLLQITDCVQQPTRNLSLGQRMRCELATALLHKPKILFLDEPTIGLDIEAQAIVRKFINNYNQEYNATIVLTSHDMDDISQIVDRILLIDNGKLKFDGSISALKQRFGPGRNLLIQSSVDLSTLNFTSKGNRLWQKNVPRLEINTLINAVLAKDPTAELTVSDPPLEEALRKAFGEEKQ